MPTWPYRVTLNCPAVTPLCKLPTTTARHRLTCYLRIHRRAFCIVHTNVGGKPEVSNCRSTFSASETGHQHSTASHQSARETSQKVGEYIWTASSTTDNSTLLQGIQEGMRRSASMLAMTHTCRLYSALPALLRSFAVDQQTGSVPHANTLT